MKEIYVKGSKLFEFKDENAIQIVGRNIELITMIIDIYYKVFNGYKFTDVDVEAMGGYYPEVIKNGQSLKKKDMFLIKLSNMNDMIDQLTRNKTSILMKNILYLKDNMLVNELLIDIEERLTKLSIQIDELLDDKMKMEDISIKNDVYNMNFKNIVKNFIDVNFIRDNSDRVPSWLLDENESIDLFINLIKLVIDLGEEITIIVDRIDSQMNILNYRRLIKKLYKLTEQNSNFKIWIVPSTSEGVFLDYTIFKNTYIISDEITKLGDFTTTYESICRNYPDNNIPKEEEVLRSLLQFLPFYNEEHQYYPTREVIIMSIFQKLLGDKEDIILEYSQLSRLEKKFLTKLN